MGERSVGEVSLGGEEKWRDERGREEEAFGIWRFHTELLETLGGERRTNMLDGAFVMG